MNTPSLDLARMLGLRSVLRMGWPAWGGAFLGIIGVAMLVGVLAAHYATKQLSLETESLDQAKSQGPSLVVEKTQTSSGVGLTPIGQSIEGGVPSPASHLQDLRLIFELVKDHEIAIRSVQYESHRDQLIPVLHRTLTVAMKEDYPKLKRLMAKILNSMPHATVQEIRIERQDALAPPALAIVKIALVYDDSDGPKRPLRQ